MDSEQINHGESEFRIRFNFRQPEGVQFHADVKIYARVTGPYRKFTHASWPCSTQRDRVQTSDSKQIDHGESEFRIRVEFRQPEEVQIHVDLKIYARASEPLVTASSRSEVGFGASRRRRIRISYPFRLPKTGKCSNQSRYTNSRTSPCTIGPLGLRVETDRQRERRAGISFSFTVF